MVFTVKWFAIIVCGLHIHLLTITTGYQQHLWFAHSPNKRHTPTQPSLPAFGSEFVCPVSSPCREANRERLASYASLSPRIDKPLISFCQCMCEWLLLFLYFCAEPLGALSCQYYQRTRVATGHRTETERVNEGMSIERRRRMDNNISTGTFSRRGGGPRRSTTMSLRFNKQLKLAL